MRLDLDDGYTLAGETVAYTVNRATGEVEDRAPLPVVTYTYRPALPEALADWRMRTRRAATGKEEVRALAEFLFAHLVSWDVTNKGEPAALSPEAIAHVPEPILDQLLKAVCEWAPKAGEARGNS